MKCVICDAETHSIIDPQITAEYDVCTNCEFIYKSKEFHVTFKREHEEYNKHNNSMENEGYVNIFKNIIKDFISELNIERKVLEFGSGPNPVFKEILEDNGFNVFDYDPFYNENERYKENKYQLITSNEVIEHFSNPIKEFELLVSLLEEGGYLLISTLFRKMDEESFLTWWYKRDLTHIAFYNMTTFEHLAKKFNLDIVKHNDKNIVVFQKK